MLLLIADVIEDDIISTLRSRVSEQKQTLSRVAFLEKSLQTQLQAQQSTQRSVDELKGVMTAFGRTYEHDSDARDFQAASTDVMADK